MRGQGHQVYLDDEDLIVQPGDEISCYLALSDAGDQALFRFLRVAGDGGRFGCTVVMSAEDGRPARGSTAQAILERPGAPYIETAETPAGVERRVAKSAGLYPLPDFGEATISSMAASSRESGGDPVEESANWMRLLSVFAMREDPVRTITIARPARGDGRGLRMNYSG